MSSSRPSEIKITSPKQANSFIGAWQGKLDNIQLKHKLIGFIYAVIKKYGQDQGSNQAALITYYGFLSLFPLLIVALSLTQLSILRGLQIKTSVIKVINSYFPLIGHQLVHHIHSSSKAGAALVISILITIYGAKGVASAFQQAMDHIWQVPVNKRTHFPFSLFRSFGIIFLIGIGFVLTGALSSYGAGISSSIIVKIAAYAVSLLLTFAVLQLVFKISISPHKSFKQLWVGSIIATIALEIVQSAAGFIIANELKHFSSLYGSLAIVFVVLFWIYLQVRIVLYATEIDSVINFRLWPRSLTGFRLTAADRKALVLYAKREKMAPTGSEEIDVHFHASESGSK